MATLVRSDAIDHDFISEHTVGFDEVKQALLEIPAKESAAAAEISIADIERCAAMIAAAKAMVVRVELGIQQGVNSTLNSYSNTFSAWLVLLPAHNPIGPFDFAGGFDDRSDRKQPLGMMTRGYEDIRQFIEPVLGASGETVGST